MGEKGNFTEEGRLPGVPRLGSTTAGEASSGTELGGDWSAKPPGDPGFGKATDTGWSKGPADWTAQPGTPAGPSVPPPGPPPGAPPMEGFLAGRRDDEDQPSPPGGAHPPPPPSGS